LVVFYIEAVGKQLGPARRHLDESCTYTLGPGQLKLMEVSHLLFQGGDTPRMILQT